MTIREAMSKVSADIKESAKAQHEIDKENFRKVKEQSAENFREATSLIRVSGSLWQLKELRKRRKQLRGT